MNILLKKVYRDLRYNKGRSISVILIIAISTALYGGLLLAHHNAEATFQDNEDRLNIESVRFSTENFNPNNLDFSEIEEIEVWDYRLSLITGIEIKGDNTTYTAPIYGIPKDQHPKVNNIEVLEGKFLSEYESPRILLIKQFIENNDLDVGDNVSMFTIGQGGQSVKNEIKIGGSVFSPEYLYSVNPKTGLPDISGLAAGWLPLNYAQQLFKAEDTVNEILVRFNEETRNNEDKLNAAIKEVKQELENHTPQVSYTKLENEPDQEMKEGDLGALDDMARVFGILILILALFGIYDNISKLIASQRNYIGTMRALGGSKKKVVLHYTSMAVVLGVVGVILGIPLGWLTGFGMINQYANVLGIPRPTTKFQLMPFVEAISINFGLSVLSGLVSAITATNIKPREAMSSAYISMVFQAKPIFEKIMSKIPGFRSVSASIPLRTLFRNKKKTLITIFTYAISIILIISAIGFINSFNASLERNYGELEKYDMQVYFNPNSPVPSSVAIDEVKDISGIDKIESFVSEQIEFKYKSSEKSVNVYGYQKNSSLRKFEFANGGNRDGLVLGKILADEMEVSKGDTIEVQNRSVKITGISTGVIADAAYLPLEQSQFVFNMGNNISGVLVSLNDGADGTEVKKDIQESNLPVSVIISTSDVRQSIQTLIQGFLSMIYIMIIIGFITVALFSFNTIVLEVISRENEFINLRSIGASKWKIAKIITIQGLLIALVGSIITIPLGYFVTDLMIQEMVEGLMIIPTVIRPTTYVFAIGAALLATFAGIIAGFRHVLNLDLVEKLRTRVSN